MLDEILRKITQAGGRPFEVGGCVRDRLIGIPCKDIDIEVFQLSAENLTGILNEFGKVDCVGVSFGVIKLKSLAGIEYDFTLPRRESKSGRGHRGFLVEVDHSMSVDEAAARRDFTINSIYRCPLNETLIDPYNGASHLRQKVLHCTSDQFGEDPLRVLRGMQFAGRFELNATEPTLVKCRELLNESQDLAQDRIWAEWEKWAARSRRPSLGLEFLQACHWLGLYPELKALVNVPQDPHWHPEGDVWTHTLHVCDAAAEIAEREQLEKVDRIVLMFAALCHDLGKATHTKFSNGRWCSPGHEAAGVEPTLRFLERIGCPVAIRESIVPLVANHLAHQVPQVTARMVRRLSVRMEQSSIELLGHLIEADVSGRPPLPKRIPENARRIVEISKDLKIDRNPPKPIVLGRHLIALGYRPSPWFGQILTHCFEAQLDGEFEDESAGLLFLQTLLAQGGQS
jgi:tRNA nucleotidyltransferase (CCA-adding enzyme)